MPFSFLPTLALAIALTLLVTPFLFAQQRWERTYGGTGSDWGESVQQTQDGGYIVAGGYDCFGTDPQVYLIKTNAFGDTLWTRTYGGTSYDDGNSVQQTSDGGYIVAGTTASFGNGNQVYLIKTNSFGATLWSRTYGGAGDDIGHSVHQTQDSGYIVAGTTTSFGNGYQVYLIKTNASGDTLWTRVYGGVNDEESFSVQQTQDGGYIVAGDTTSYGASDADVYLIKTDAFGDTLWTRTYGGANYDYGYSVQQTLDGGYIIAGGTNSFGPGGYNIYLIKTDATGDTLWTRTYGGTNYDYGSSLHQTSDGGYVIAGSTYSFGAGGCDVYLVRTNTSGDTLWTRTYGGTHDDVGWSGQQVSDGGYIIAGGTISFGNASQVYLIKTDANGNAGVKTAEVRGQRLEVRLTARPNPFTAFATVPGHASERFALYDISGRRVGTYRGDRIGEGLGPGVYFVCEGTACRAPTRIVKVR